MKSPPQEYRRKLPHIQPEQAIYFVTFSLKGALPKHVTAELSNKVSDTQRNLLISSKTKQNAVLEYNEQIEDVLHSEIHGKQWLKQPHIAKIITDSLHFIDGRDFKIICYCIMSNHVHFVAYSCEKPLHKIMHSLKSFTANGCNKALGLSGSFWQREYFDRIVRDRNDLAKKIEYVINNPVHAGLVNKWEDYPFTYCNPSFVE